jgi:tetratricopeptide (TPR) repeat protein
MQFEKKITILVQTAGKYAESLDKSNKLMNYANKQNESQVPEKKEVTSHIYSNIGNANLEMGKYAQALEAHNKDLDISKEMFVLIYVT